MKRKTRIRIRLLWLNGIGLTILLWSTLSTRSNERVLTFIWVLAALNVVLLMIEYLNSKLYDKNES